MIDFACKQFDIKEIIKCSLSLTRSELSVLEHLLHHPGESYSSEEIAKRLGLDLSTVQRTMKKLHEKNVVKRMQINLAGGGYIFEYQVHDRKVLRKIILETVASWTRRVEHELEHW